MLIGRCALRLFPFLLELLHLLRLFFLELLQAQICGRRHFRLRIAGLFLLRQLPRLLLMQVVLALLLALKQGFQFLLLLRAQLGVVEFRLLFLLQRQGLLPLLPLQLQALHLGALRQRGIYK